MIVRFIAWRLAVAAAFAVCIALIQSAPAAAAANETGQTAEPRAKTARTPAARVHTLMGTALEPARPARPPHRAAPASARVPAQGQANAGDRSSADGVVLDDGTFALFANY